MISSLNLRQEQIVAWLKESDVLAIPKLAERLNVSIMTIHRDLDRLVSEGQVQKLRGTVRLATEPAVPKPAANRCDLCNMRVPQRTAVSIHLSDGQKLSACCPHCGILLLAQNETASTHSGGQAVSALARDFLYGRMINMRQSTFVINSDVELCCLPNTICFRSEADARKFQLGFNGKVTNFQEALLFHNEHHQHHQHPY